MSETIKYKFRAECCIDVIRFIQEMGSTIQWFRMDTIKEGFPGQVVEVEIDGCITLPILIECCNNVLDGHVIAQTVQPIADYTGDRDFTR